MIPALWQVFVDAIELGSLSRVAAVHGTSQPRISRLLSDLEKECGARLLNRTGRGVTLTEFGERVAPQIRAWLSATDDLATQVRGAAGTPIGRVRIGSLPSTAHPLLTTVSSRLKKQFPLVQIAVREGQGSQLDAWLDEGSVDMAILFRTSPLPRNGDIYLYRVPTFLVGPPGDPITYNDTVEFRQLNGLPLVLFCRPSAWRNHLEMIAAEHDVALNVAMEADSLSLQTHMANAGVYHALLGPQAITAAAPSCPLQCARIVAPVIYRHVALAMSPRGKSTIAGQAVVQAIRGAIQTAGAGPDPLLAT